jgi:hypothetical protein
MQHDFFGANNHDTSTSHSLYVRIHHTVCYLSGHQALKYMDESNIQYAVVQVISDSSIQDAFNSGLYFAATIVAMLFSFSMIRSITDGSHEDL